MRTSDDRWLQLTDVREDRMRRAVSLGASNDTIHRWGAHSGYCFSQNLIP